MSMPWQPSWSPGTTPPPAASNPVLQPTLTPTPDWPVPPSEPPAVTPSLKEEIAGIVQDMVTEILHGAGVPETPPTASISDLTKASARSRAVRTLFIGLGVSVLWALVNVISQVAGLNWDNNGWQQVLTLVIGTVVSSASSYVLRILKAPSYDQPSKSS